MLKLSNIKKFHFTEGMGVKVRNGKLKYVIELQACFPGQILKLLH